MARLSSLFRQRRTSRRAIRNSLRSSVIQRVRGLFKQQLAAQDSGAGLDAFSSDSLFSASSNQLTLFEQGFDTLLGAGLGFLGARREKQTTVVGESARSQELQQQFNLSRSQRAALLTEATQRGGRNL